MSLLIIDREGQKPGARDAAFGLALACLGLGLVLLVLASSASIASEPAAIREGSWLGSDALLAGWLAAFVALTALYSFERRQHTKTGMLALQKEPASPAPSGASTEPAAPEPRPIELLLKRKPSAAPPEAPRPPTPPAPKPSPPEESARPGAKEAGEESFSVVDTAIAQPTAPPAPAAPPDAAPTSPPAPAPAAARLAPEARLERCAALRAAGRFDEAARVARDGLAGGDELVPLLIELSHAELGLGRVNAAIDTARDAHFVARSRATLSHLIRLLTETRRFSPEEGAVLSRAAARHPRQPLLRHAAGVFASLHGDLSLANQELREALRLAVDSDLRRAIERDLARLAAQGRS